jgi:AmmeMemoRadiSam system protein B
VEAFATPLGSIRLDAPAIARIAELPQVVFSDHVHAFEHSLEVHLPFLQRVLEQFTLVPLAVGQPRRKPWPRCWTCCGAARNADRRQLRPVALPALRHAQQVDRNTCRHILQLDTHIHPAGLRRLSINGLLLAAGRRGLKPTLLGLCNSGDTAGDRSRVVGYAAFAFAEGADMAELATPC